MSVLELLRPIKTTEANAMPTHAEDQLGTVRLDLWWKDARPVKNRPVFTNERDEPRNVRRLKPRLRWNRNDRNRDNHSRNNSRKVKNKISRISYDQGHKDCSVR